MNPLKAQMAASARVCVAQTSARAVHLQVKQARGSVEHSSNSNSNSNRHLAPMVQGSTAGHMERVHTQEPNAQRKMKATKTMQPSLTC